MTNINYYDMCCRYKGRVVNIRSRDGKTHVGKIVDVTRTHVYIQPTAPRGLGGFGYGYYGGFGFRPFAIPLAFVTGLALGLFFW